MPCKGWADSWTDPSGSGLVLEYTVVDDGVSITKITNAPSTLIIPSKIDEKSVVAIGESVYSSEEYTSLLIPASVTSIGNGAFADGKLSSITMEGATPCTLGTNAFGAFSSYSSIYIPLGSKASYLEATSWSNYQANLEELITDETGNLRFKEYQQGELYLAGFVTGKSAESITIPATITVNGQELPVTGTYSSAFTSKKISSVTFAKDSQLKVIGQGAFSQTSLTKVTIPASVTKMESLAFGSCNSLTTVIMESATPCTLTYAPFRGCPSDLKIYVPVGTVEAYKSKSGWSDYKNQIFEMPTPPITDETGTLLFEKNAAGDGLILKGFADGKSEANITIPASVEADGTELPVTAIADNAFNNNTTLTSVSIPSSVKTIGAEAFHTCSNLTSIVINGDGLQELGQFAFAGTGITSIVLPSSLTKTGEYTLSACASLKNVKFNSKYITSYEGNNTFTGSNNIEHIFVPASALDSYKTKFSNNEAKIITEFEVGSFKYQIYDDLKTVACTGLASDNAEATTISIPASISFGGLELAVTTIGVSAFNGNRSLTSVDFSEAINLTTISKYAFANTTGLQSITIPESVTFIGEMAFMGSTVSEVNFPEEGNLELGSLSFAYTLVSELTIPKSVKKLNDGAFASCTLLETVNMESETPCELGKFAFCNEVDEKNAAIINEGFNIYVPKDKVETYQKAWTSYQEYIGVKPVAPITIVDDGENGVTSEMEGKTYEAGKITYKRTFSQAGQYGTIALPFNVASSEWNQYFDAVYTVSGAESMGDGLSKLKFQKVEQDAPLYAKDAYFVKLKDDVQDVTLTNAEETQIVADPMVNCRSVSYDDNDVTVTITPHASWQKVDGNGAQYYTFNADGTFGKSDYVVPFRMCLTIETSGGGNFFGAPAFFSIELPGGSTTGINGVSAEKASKNAAICSIDGKLVRANGDTKGLAKGVYIIGGKKIVVK